MKQIILIFTFISTVFANNHDYELKLYEKVISSLLKSDNISVISDNDLKPILEKSNKFTITNNCKDAKVVIGKEIKEQCKDLPWFATNYKTFKYGNNVIGAFYWRKGRPQLKLKTQEINKFKLELPKSLEKYAK
jgi:hypothetical protein